MLNSLQKPARLSMVEAAALPLVCITAWEDYLEKLNFSRSNSTGSAVTGGVGHVAIQLAGGAGATAYATVSSEEKAEIAKSLGVSETINYRSESVQDYIQRLTDGRGFDVIFDSVGGDNIDKSILAVANTEIL